VRVCVNDKQQSSQYVVVVSVAAVVITAVVIAHLHVLSDSSYETLLSRAHVRFSHTHTATHINTDTN
jgi:hypothetical protein